MSPLIVVLQLLLLGFVLVNGRYHYRRHVRYSPELISDFRDFTKLIPSVTIDELVAEHMITDSGFRKAIKFLRSSDFKALQRRTESLPAVADLIKFTHLNDTVWKPNTIHWYHSRHRREVIAEELLIVLLHSDVMYPDHLSSFTSFVQDVLTHLPRDRFVALVQKKRKSSPIFAKFYEAIRSPEFKTKVEAAWQTTGVQSVIRELSGHSINSQDLKAIGYEVISWGPS
ncbi:hypothetical protein KR009_007390 [Drosophila setifemur]|nr:hypothetical protein KR009_007390 [Drosophila setifemur]